MISCCATEELPPKTLQNYKILKNDKNSDNGINQSNSVIGIKLLRAQKDPIKRRPL